MGTDYYLVDHRHREKFELGRGPWHDSILVILPMYEYVETKVHLVNAHPAVARKALKRIWEWCSARDWEVALVRDTDDSYADAGDYISSGNIFIEIPGYPDEIMRKIGKIAKDLRIDMCAEEVQLKVIIPDSNSDRVETTEYHSTVGEHIIEHGYYINVRKPVWTCSCGCEGEHE